MWKGRSVFPDNQKILSEKASHMQQSKNKKENMENEKVKS